MWLLGSHVLPEVLGSAEGFVAPVTVPDARRKDMRPRPITHLISGTQLTWVSEHVLAHEDLRLIGLRQHLTRNLSDTGFSALQPTELDLGGDPLGNAALDIWHGDRDVLLFALDDRQLQARDRCR